MFFDKKEKKFFFVILIIIISIITAIITSIFGYIIYTDKKDEQAFLEKFKKNKKDFEEIKAIVLNDAEKDRDIHYKIYWKEKEITSWFLINDGEDFGKTRDDLVLTEDEWEKLYKIKDENYTRGMWEIEVYKGQVFIGGPKTSYVFSENGSEPNKDYYIFNDYKYTIKKMDDNWYWVWTNYPV